MTSETPWTCPKCGSGAWSYDGDPECVTRWCDDCGCHANPGDKHYPVADEPKPRPKIDYDFDMADGDFGVD